MDIVSKEKRSEMMSRVRGSDTKPERMVKKALWSAGFRYARSRYGLVGTPDVILPRHKVVVFVHGCFWHGHGCKKSRLPNSNAEFWQEKIATNRQRDARAVRRLRKQGWKCYTVWECRLPSDIRRLIARIKSINLD